MPIEILAIVFRIRANTRCEYDAILIADFGFSSGGTIALSLNSVDVPFPAGEFPDLYTKGI
jgi:hypothetical protein